MKKKLILISLSLALLLSACSKEDSYEVGTINNKDNPTEMNNSVGEIKRDNENKDNKGNKKDDDELKGSEDSKNKDESLDKSDAKKSDIEERKTLKIMTNIKKKADKIVSDNKKDVSKEDAKIIEDKLVKIRENAKKFELSMVGTDDPVILNVSHYIFAVQKNETVEMFMGIQKGYDIKLTKIKEENAKNLAVELSLVDKDGDQREVFVGYYNKDSDIITLRQNYKTEKEIKERHQQKEEVRG